MIEAEASGVLGVMLRLLQRYLGTMRSNYETGSRPAVLIHETGACLISSKLTYHFFFNSATVDPEENVLVDKIGF